MVFPLQGALADSSRHRWTRTYKVSEDELRAYPGITVGDSLEEALSDIGFSYPMDSELTAGNKNTITLKSALGAHEEIEESVHEVETLRADSVKAGKAVVKVEEALKNAVPDEQGCRMLRSYLVNTPSAAKRYRKALENARTMFDMPEGDLLEVNSSAVRNSLTRLSDYLQKLDF